MAYALHVHTKYVNTYINDQAKATTKTLRTRATALVEMCWPAQPVSRRGTQFLGRELAACRLSIAQLSLTAKNGRGQG
jgi:hypothetical protein